MTEVINMPILKRQSFNRKSRVKKVNRDIKVKVIRSKPFKSLLQQRRNKSNQPSPYKKVKGNLKILFYVAKVCEGKLTILMINFYKF